MSVETLISIDEYLRTSFDPDCDYVDGHLVERNVGQWEHSETQTNLAVWFSQRRGALRLRPLVEMRMRVAEGRVRIPDVTLVEADQAKEAVLTEPPYLCIEVMSPDDSLGSIQERIDDYLEFGVPNIWLIDPWKRKCWTVSGSALQPIPDGILRTSDGRVALPLSEIIEG